jgi:hypothetical protein
MGAGAPIASGSKNFLGVRDHPMDCVLLARPERDQEKWKPVFRPIARPAKIFRRNMTAWMPCGK